MKRVRTVSALCVVVAVVLFVGVWRASGDEVTIAVRIPQGPPFASREITFEPPGVARAARLSRDGWLTVVAEARAHEVTIRVPGMCPVTLPLAGRQGERHEGAVKPWIDLGGDRSQVGFDAPFEMDVLAGCPEAARGQVEWKQIEGPPLLGWKSDQGGFRLRARTLAFAALHERELPYGIVPLSPRTQGRYVLEAVWTGAGSSPVRRIVTITSIARATGLPALAVGQKVMLGGEGWKVRKAPRGGAAGVEVASGLLLFAPDVSGQWTLEDADARPLDLRVLRHDKTPLDCGRSDCHQSIAEASMTSPMSDALERQLLTSAAPADVTCSLDCHVVGERGLHDGGFLDVADSLGWVWADSPGWQDLPRSLRRPGGVRCTSCHGPSAIPPRETRSLILRSDVCATCHDAPPTYTHVEQWRSSRMAHADDLPETRTQARCARCHTTAGFLDANRIRKRDPLATDSEGAGVACAACHTPHGPHVGDTLVRAIPVAEALGGPAVTRSNPASAVCMGCHSPAPDESPPSASAATLWRGRASVPGMGLVTGAAPHEAVPHGCIGCHGKGTSGDERPLNHSFRTDPVACSACHTDGPPKENPDARGRRVRERALALWDAILGHRPAAPPKPGRPAHASLEPSPPATPALERARYEVALVLEDPAAGVHNAPFARSLLADAEGILSTAR